MIKCYCNVYNRYILQYIHIGWRVLWMKNPCMNVKQWNRSVFIDTTEEKQFLGTDTVARCIKLCKTQGLNGIPTCAFYTFLDGRPFELTHAHPTPIIWRTTNLITVGSWNDTLSFIVAKWNSYLLVWRPVGNLYGVLRNRLLWISTILRLQNN